MTSVPVGRRETTFTTNVSNAVFLFLPLATVSASVGTFMLTLATVAQALLTSQECVL